MACVRLAHSTRRPTAAELQYQLSRLAVENRETPVLAEFTSYVDETVWVRINARPFAHDGATFKFSRQWRSTAVKL